MTNEDKIIENINKFHIKYIEDLDNEKIVEGFEYLKKSYLKLNKRYERIIKQSDNKQWNSIKLHEKTTDNITKLKSHIISKTAQTTTQGLKDKEENLFKIEEQNRKINSLNKIIDEKDILNKKLEITKERYSKENAKLLSIIDKNNLEMSKLIEIELQKSKSLNFIVSLIVIKIDNMDDIYQKLASSGKINTLISSLERYFSRTAKQYDIVRYMGDGVFYILFYDDFKHTVTEFIAKAITGKVLENIKIKFIVGQSISTQTITPERFLNDALQDVGLKKTF